MENISLLTYPDERLRSKARLVSSFDDDLALLVKKMSRLMYVNKGIGLASSQVGSPLSLFLVDIGDGLNVFINPEISSPSKTLDTMEEGCLSLPGILVKVSRPKTIGIKYNDLDGNIIERSYAGLMAKVLQHENDHLSGRMIIDYQNIFKAAYNKVKLKLSKTKNEIYEI